MVRHSGLAASIIGVAKNGKISQVALQKALDQLVMLEPSLISKAFMGSKISKKSSGLFMSDFDGSQKHDLRYTKWSCNLVLIVFSGCFVPWKSA